jgi:hypothetical protein
MHWLGLEGMPRRVYDYAPRFADLNFFISVCAFVLGASTLVFLYNIVHSWKYGEIAPANPWRALTLEWQVSSPPPIFNFDEPPQVVGGPYEYGTPGARHAIVRFHTPEPELVTSRPAALPGGAVAAPERREAVLSAMKHILVVANQTVAGDKLIAALKERAGTEPVRVTVICPESEPGGAWVIDEARVHEATQARLDRTLTELRAAGVEADGEVVSADPYTAVLDQVEGSDPPQEIIISTLPSTRSGWMRRDLVDRVRDRTKLPVEHVVVDPAAEKSEA